MKKAIVILFLCGAVLTGLAQESYTLSDASTLSIDGTSTVHDWTVTATEMEGTLQGDSGTVGSIEFSVPVADIKSDRAAAMDKKMHEALKAENHPKVVFSVKDAGTSIGENQELKGTLSIAGTENEVTVPVSMSEADGKFKITGQQKIILQDYGIEPPTAMFGSIVVGDDVTVKFDLTFSN